MKQLESCRRVDVVWDTYIVSSIKESTREKRGKGIRRKVADETKMPGNWSDFLRGPNNKQELFQFLSDKISSTDWPGGKQMSITSGEKVVSRGTAHDMPLCDHEEADTRIVRTCRTHWKMTVTAAWSGQWTPMSSSSTLASITHCPRGTPVQTSGLPLVQAKTLRIFIQYQ